MLAQQTKIVRRQRLHRPQATTTIRPPPERDENTIIDVVPHEEVAPGIAAPTRDRATITRERHHRNPPWRGNSNMRDGCGPLRGHNGALKRRAGVSVLTHGSQQAPLPRAIPPPELQPQIHDHASAGNVTEHRRPDRINQHLPKSLLDIHAAEDYPSATAVRLPQKPNTQQHHAQALAGRQRNRERLCVNDPAQHL